MHLKENRKQKEKEKQHRMPIKRHIDVETVHFTLAKIYIRTQSPILGYAAIM